MRSGQLRHRVTLQVLAETPDTFGQPIEAWATAGTYWAFVRDLAGREAVNARQIKAEVTHAVTLRYAGSQALDESMQLLFRGVVLKIGSVLNVDNRNRQYELLCVEVKVPNP